MALIQPLDDSDVKALKLTKVMKRAIMGAGVFGRLWGDGNRRDKTFPALVERGLAYVDRGFVLTELGLRVRATLRTQIGLKP